MNNSEITRNVILDLLPLYLAGETSDDSTALVEDYMRKDPEMAKMIERMSSTKLNEVPAPVSREDALEAYTKANQRLLYRTLLLGFTIVVVVMGLITLVMAIINGGFG